jgi:hypothetical protein
MKVLASSFADLADVRAFERCKARGKSDQECFKVGDNGRGCWNDITAQEVTPMCALPPDDVVERFGTFSSKARFAMVRVTVLKTGRSVVCVLADRMPWKKNIKNGAGIDLNPAAAKALGLKPPFLVPASWEWAECP